MADEALFLLLHNEMVSGVYKSAEQGEVENGRCITKLENMGFRVGQGLIERFTKDTARFKDELDIMKFICKDFWTTVFKKQIDNLRTNHQYLAFTCGLIRGGLSNLGIKSIVTAEVSSMPACQMLHHLSHTSSPPTRLLSLNFLKIFSLWLLIKNKIYLSFTVLPFHS
ncbi:trafficking protein particle complex subunit 6B isoform X2 [Castor canadensis]|uniref:Trafficking protein particle complex subunit 6B isoform X2 n=1 Tax=Castor canadensis TaxID=51338 RepID=A0AC58M478_CASCN